jgi:hypothetical protein
MQKLQTEKLEPIKLPQLPDNPLVSVLIANYNYARYISQTLESVLCQTYPHFEVIVCDDGSSDNSCEVIETYVQKDSRIKLVSKPNGGVASALNAAYQEHKGQIICLLDADDVWIAQKLEKVVEAFKSKPKCGFVIHNVIQINGEGNFLKSSAMYKQLASGWMAESALENGGFVHNIPPASALSVRKEVADFIFPLNEEFKRNADSLIFRLSPFITEIEAVPEVLSQFRLHGANTTSSPILTVDGMEKEQPTLARIHQEQKQFLTNVYGTEIAQMLTDWQSSLTICRNHYLLARLKGAPRAETKKAHEKLITHPKFKALFSDSVPQRLLFQWGEYLPNALFTTLFHQIYGKSLIKSVVRSLLGEKLSTSSAGR